MPHTVSSPGQRRLYEILCNEVSNSSNNNSSNKENYLPSIIVRLRDVKSITVSEIGRLCNCYGKIKISDFGGISLVREWSQRRQWKTASNFGQIL